MRSIQSLPDTIQETWKLCCLAIDVADIESAYEHMQKVLEYFQQIEAEVPVEVENAYARILEKEAAL